MSERVIDPEDLAAVIRRESVRCEMTEGVDFILCPHCGHKDESPGEHFDSLYDHNTSAICDGCDKVFGLTMNIAITYSTNH